MLTHRFEVLRAPLIDTHKPASFLNLLTEHFSHPAARTRGKGRYVREGQVKLHSTGDGTMLAVTAMPCRLRMNIGSERAKSSRLSVAFSQRTGQRAAT